MSECYLARTEDGRIHAFSSTTARTAMCSKTFEKLDAGDEETEVCERCAVEALAVLGVSDEGKAEIAKLFDKKDE